MSNTENTTATAESFTPAPWTVVEVNHLGAAGHVVMARHLPVDEPWTVAEVHKGEANARLIAAAPELVELVEQFQAWAEQIQNDEDRVPLDLRYAAAALLAKIRG